jgi:hypothetical protein
MTFVTHLSPNKLSDLFYELGGHFHHLAVDDITDRMKTFLLVTRSVFCGALYHIVFTFSFVIPTVQ